MALDNLQPGLIHVKLPSPPDPLRSDRSAITVLDKLSLTRAAGQRQRGGGGRKRLSDCVQLPIYRGGGRKRLSDCVQLPMYRVTGCVADR